MEQWRFVNQDHKQYRGTQPQEEDGRIQEAKMPKLHRTVHTSVNMYAIACGTYVLQRRSEVLTHAHTTRTCATPFVSKRMPKPTVRKHDKTSHGELGDALVTGMLQRFGKGITRGTRNRLMRRASRVFRAFWIFLNFVLRMFARRIFPRHSSWLRFLAALIRSSCSAMATLSHK